MSLVAPLSAILTLVLLPVVSGKKQWWSEPQPHEVRLISKYDPMSTKLYQTLPTQIGEQQVHPVLSKSPIVSPESPEAEQKRDKQYQQDQITDDTDSYADDTPMARKNKKSPKNPKKEYGDKANEEGDNDLEMTDANISEKHMPNEGNRVSTTSLLQSQ